MTEIRWKNGGPLFIQPRPGGGPIGLVAVDPDCCCGDGNPPPPPRCWDCGDTCSYFIEIVSPAALAVKSPAASCADRAANAFGADYSSAPLAVSIDAPEDFDQTIASESKGVVNWNSFSNDSNADLQSLVTHNLFKKPADILQPFFFRAYATVRIEVACRFGRTPTTHFLSATASAYVIITDPGSNEITADANVWTWTASGEYDLSSTCVPNSPKQCFPYTDSSRFLDTPIEITVDGTGTTLGAYSSTIIETDPGDRFAEAESIGEALRNALSVTFRITSRPACTNIPADCGVPIEGRIVYFPKNSVAVYGYEFGTPKTDVYDFGAWEFAHDGVANGTAESPYVFNAKKFAENPAGFILEEHNLEVFCALDDTVTPPVSRWYVREFVYCTPEFGRQTTDQWISEIPTYPEPDRETPCEGVSAGDPVPVGITEYERVDGYPIVDFGEPCDPPPPIGLQITDGCS